MGQCLCQTRAVTAHHQPFGRHVDGEAVAAAVDRAVAGGDSRLDHALDRNRLTHERDLALRRPRDVDQLLDQMPHARDLSVENFAQANQDGVAVLERAQHAGGVGDRRQRVAQLVREHREELALSALGQAQLPGSPGKGVLEQLALVNIDQRADESDRFARAAPARYAVLEHPSVFTIAAAQAQVERIRTRSLEARGLDADAALEVFGMDSAGPPHTSQSGFRNAGEDGPRWAQPVMATARAGAPDQHRRGHKDRVYVGLRQRA